MARERLSSEDARAELAKTMLAGGYVDRVLAAGPELDRVKQFLLVLTGRREPQSPLPYQAPWLLPLFPGLRHQAFDSPEEQPATALLERAFPAIQREADALEQESFIDYTEGMATPGSRWTLYPFFYMGVEVTPFSARCPATLDVLRSLPRNASRVPWGDALFSAHDPGTNLTPHCSVDNLRLRCHLGLRIPDGCGLRVGSETRTWTEGRCLSFEDSFEHEAWNRGASRRVILLVDLWHPDLTDAEIRALTAGFRKSEVRTVFFRHRLTDASYAEFFLSAFAAEDDDDLIREFWPR